MFVVHKKEIDKSTLMKKLILIFVLTSFSTAIFCQKTRKEKKQARNEKINALIKQEEEGLIVFKKHMLYGVTLNTDGYGIMLEKGIRQDRRKTVLYRLEISEKKHPKEERLSDPNTIGQVNSFIYAKLNNFYQVRLGYGYQYLIGSKGNKNGIEVSAVGVGGLTLGLAKPYYYDVEDIRGNRKRLRFDTDDTTTYFINGASGFSYGWKELKINPGAFLKAGLRFEYGRFNESVSAVDVGLFGEFYSTKVPQMYLVKQRQFFVGAYISMVFGKRK
jgi:hypothetical protein